MQTPGVLPLGRVQVRGTNTVPYGTLTDTSGTGFPVTATGVLPFSLIVNSGDPADPVRRIEARSRLVPAGAV